MRKKIKLYASELLKIFIKIFPISKFFLKRLPNIKKVDIYGHYTLLDKMTMHFYSYLARYGTKEENIEKTILLMIDNKKIQMNLNIYEYTQCRYYFYPESPELINLLKKGGGVMLDIGANVGYFSLLAANFFDNVYSFEPGKSTIPRLCNNIQLNNFENIQVMKCAISNKKTQLTLHENPINQGGNTLEGFSDKYKKSQIDEDRWIEYVVDTDTLDNIFDKFSKKIDMFKIDVEGHELSVIEGAINTIHIHKPLIYIEIFRRSVFDKIQELLSFEYISYDPILNEPIRLDSRDWDFQNILFIPRSILKNTLHYK